MGLNTGIALIDGLSDIGIKDIFAYQAAQNQSKIDLGMADTSNYVARLNAQAALLQGQVAAQAYQQSNSNSWVSDNKWLLVAGAALVVGVIVIAVKK